MFYNLRPGKLPSQGLLRKGNKKGSLYDITSSTTAAKSISDLVVLKWTGKRVSLSVCTRAKGTL